MEALVGGVPAHGSENKMIFEIPSTPNHSLILQDKEWPKPFLY